MNGLMLAFQFFTIIPINKELPLGKKEITMMYCSLPFIGSFIGLFTAATYIVSTDVLGFSPLLTAVLLVAIGFGLTGGLHLDGWADTADAFFSYKKIEKRFEILDDPRLGAFGTMALILLIFIKVAVVYEALIQEKNLIFLFVMIPLLARASLNICFATLPSGKKEGLGYFFKERLVVKPVIIWSVICLITPFLIYIFNMKQLVFPLIALFIISVAIILFRRWAKRNFNGITGDLAGAFIEGMEVFLWLLILVLL